MSLEEKLRKSGPMKNCLIVGAGEGVSRSVARRFRKGGFRVGLVSRNASNLRKLANDLIEDGMKAFWATADAGDATELKRAISSLINEMGTCDVLIYNAAVLKPGNPLDKTADQIAAELEVSVLGAHRAGPTGPQHVGCNRNSP